MQIIKQLPPLEAQKIAAGEVVERPASVVKELVENAIDAGATTITITCNQGGTTGISVTDNGCGMSPEDARICCKLHTTSKLSAITELTQLSSFGFRGEALASISAVSTVTITTPHADASHGTKISIIPGQRPEEHTVSAPVGTTVAIGTLFEFVPARQKFLKKPETEWRHITLLFNAICFSHLHINFKLIHNGTIAYHCPPVTQIQDRIAQVWDTAHATQSIAVCHEDKGITVTGAVTTHQYHRYDRSHLTVFVNNRWVKNTHLINAIIKAYDHVLPPGTFPAGVIAVHLDAEQVDINVHPRKQEVHCAHPRRVDRIITDAIRSALEQHVSHTITQPVALKQIDWSPKHTAQTGWATTPWKNTPAVTSQPRTAQQQSTPVLEPSEQAPFEHATITPAPLQPSVEMQHTVDDHSTTDTSFRHYRVIGIAHKTYIMLEHPEGIVYVDQHAAHERVLYERFAQKVTAIEQAALLFPHTITVSPADSTLLETHKAVLGQFGISLEPLSHDQIVITHTPLHLKNHALDEIVHQCIQWIHEYETVPAADLHTAVTRKMQAMMACKAAVKAGDELNNEQVKQLLADLDATPHRLTCPHGRPTTWLFALYDLEKTFRRIGP